MNQAYQGTELELFAAARNWKTYFARQLAPYIGARVLEVGAGLGSNIPYLSHAGVREWLCLEPDPEMARGLGENIARGALPTACRVIQGGIERLPVESRFDTILYLDVLEHIERDRAELAEAGRHLEPGGALIVLAPAHPFLFSPFDAAIGHHRRYTKAMLTGIAPPGFRLQACRMLDSAGFFASLANRLLLRAAQPSRSEIEFWDRLLVPLSRLTDRATGFRFGKTILAVWSPQPATG